MKKIGLALALFLLAGCSPGGTDSQEASTSAVTPSSVEEQPAASTASSNESVSPPASVSSEEAESMVDTSNGSGEGMTLYIPDTLKQDEASPLYGQVVEIAEQFTEEGTTLGEEGLFTLIYTGYYIENEDGTVQGYFMGINRVGEPLRNLSFVLNFLVKGTPVWDSMKFNLYEDEFGVQPDNTVMPIFLDVPDGREDLLINALPEETEVEIFDLQTN